jgi:tripartite-type tricarboxylate transporter receptor subunit TctC
MRFLNAALVAVGLAAPAFSAQAAGPDGYPTKPVTIVVPFAPGGGSDTMGRLIASRLSERAKASFIVENKPGAGTNIANEAVSRAPADGHTLLFGQVTLSINPFIYKTLRYNVQKDFVPVANFAASPTVLVVSQNSPFKTLAEFMAAAKAKPGKLNYGSGGAGTSVHLAGELFESLTQTHLVHVPYRGSAPAMTDLIGGQIEAIFDTAPSAIPHIGGGRVRPLAVTGTKRLAELPNVPTFAEAGLPGFDAPAWYGLLAPAQTPPALVKHLNAEIQDILKEPATLQRLNQLGSVAMPGTAEDFGRFIRQESERWSAVVKKANVTLD